MKIALFTHVNYPFTNGVAVSVSGLANTLRKHNHQVTIVSNNYVKFSNDFSNEDDIKVTSIPIFYQNLRVPIIFNPSLLKELAKKKIEIVHSHSDFGLAMLAREYSKLEGVPLIHTYHSNYLDYAKENFGKASKYLFYEPVKLYTRLLCQTADRMIVPSMETKRLLEENFKVKINLDYIPNGVDLLKFKNRSENVAKLKKNLNIDDDDFILLSVSRLSKEKGIENVISILPYLKDCQKLKYLIVGSGPDEKRIKWLVKDLNLNNVIFIGEIPFEHIQDYYHLGNVFISNSQAETQGLSVIEALSSALPVICPNRLIFKELIDDYNNGFLFNNYEELVNIIRMCYHNKEKLSSMGASAQESIDRFSLEQSVNRIEEIYAEEHQKKLRR